MPSSQVRPTTSLDPKLASFSFVSLDVPIPLLFCESKFESDLED